MKVLQLNCVCGTGSTGRIAASISGLLNQKNYENRILYTRGKSELACARKYSNEYYVKGQALLSRILGNYGFNSKSATRRLLDEIDSFLPDIVHIHNIHGHDCDLEMLLSYLRDKKIKVVWTFHDCWAFTGYCTYFDLYHCEQWKTGCKNCPQSKRYSWLFDRSNTLWQRKKQLLTGMDLTVVTPSRWLADVTQQSFLRGCSTTVIHNGIDLSVFRPVTGSFREKYNCAEKYIILGAALEWDERKGIEAFIHLAQRLDEKYQIVLIGTNHAIDKMIPPNVISIHRTEDINELAQLYSTADLFVNPTREDNFPTVNIESLACGTPVLTYQTGGSPEMIDETCGCAVPQNDIDALEAEIHRICEKKPYSKEACVRRAAEFNSMEKFVAYVDLYRSVFRDARRT